MTMYVLSVVKGMRLEMNNELYKVIENLNKEYLTLQKQKCVKRHNRKKHIKKLIKKRKFKTLLREIYISILTKTKYKNISSNKKDKVKIVENNFNVEKSKKIVYTAILNNYDTIVT